MMTSQHACVMGMRAPGTTAQSQSGTATPPQQIYLRHWGVNR